MKLSILIPLYNKEKYIIRCIESLLNQDIPLHDFEIIIVDDGSKDNGAQIVRDFANKNNTANIRLIGQHNQGPSVARNRCLKEATGEYVYFLDADDYLAPNVLQSLLALGDKNNLDILEFNTKELTNNITTETAMPRTEALNLAYPVSDGVSYIADHGFQNEAWRYFIRKALLDETGTSFLENTLFEDAIFTATLFLKAKRISKVNLEAHRYVIVEGSIVTNKEKAHNLKFVHGMVNAAEIYHALIQDLDNTSAKYSLAKETLMVRQQSFVRALLIRTLKFGLLDTHELNTILLKMKTLDAYPLNHKLGASEKKQGFKSFILTTFFNSKPCIFTALRIMRKIAR